MAALLSTTDLSDEYGPDALVANLLFQDYGAVSMFSGPIATLWTFEDNGMVRTLLETPGEGRVLVVDGGGSLNCALVGGNLGKLAEDNGWSGVVVHGGVRDRAELAQCKTGIKALGHTPRKSQKRGIGNANIPVKFAGITFLPGDYLYADLDGIVVLPARGKRS